MVSSNRCASLHLTNVLNISVESTEQIPAWSRPREYQNQHQWITMKGQHQYRLRVQKERENLPDRGSVNSLIRLKLNDVTSVVFPPRIRENHLLESRLGKELFSSPFATSLDRVTFTRHDRSSVHRGSSYKMP
jgi:hypothetical protein